MKKTKTEDTTDVEGARSVAVLLPQLEEGTFNAELSDDVRSLVAEMRDNQKDTGRVVKGKVTITLDMKLVDGVFEINADYKVAAPKKTRSRTLLFATDGNNLVRDNPRQPDLPNIRDVTADKAPARAI